MFIIFLIGRDKACPISYGLNEYNLTWRETREGCQDDEKLSHKQQQAGEQGDDLRAPFFSIFGG